MALLPDDVRSWWTRVPWWWLLPVLAAILIFGPCLWWICCYTKWVKGGMHTNIATPYLTAGYPWWWLLLLLLLLLLLILLCCCLLWCLNGRYRARRESRRTESNGQHVPLIAEDKSRLEQNLHNLESRLDKMRGAADSSAKGDFEKGYMKGYHDANKLGSASAARRRMDEMDDRYHPGYVRGLREAGMTGMSTSMRNLAQKGPGGGYSHGFMQGYKDGNTGIFGDRVTPSIISRLDEQYPGQDDFKQGYVDGFKEGTGSRGGKERGFEDSRRLQQSLTELTERLTSLEKTKGDEIHSTKIYHVYNQQGEAGYAASTGAQLAHELEELSTSRRSTLRRHYTPGDYLRDDSGTYNSLSRNRRSLSASALAAKESSTMETSRLDQRSRHASGTNLGSSYITRGAGGGTDTYSKRYNYRSRSDVGSPRRYASQTLLDGSRPGPSTPYARKDALSTLQKELDSLSRSPDRRTPGGYTSDTAYDTVRSKAKGYSNYDYDTYQSTRQEMRQSSATGASSSAQGASASGARQGATSSVRYPVTTTVTSTINNKEASGVDDGRWADDLLDIVQEPMNKTLDRMKKYSSTANVEGGQSGDVVEEKYSKYTKEEHSSGR